MNLVKLGYHQREVYRALKGGYFIQVHVDFSSGTSTCEITNGGDFYSIPKKTLENFVKRGIVKGKTFYTTINPDTETIHYTLTA